jgi:PTH1 family peptidyl-tRNA hydrolase
MSDIALIVGLGNPGAKYENTRHNIGWMAVEALAKKHGLSFSKQEHKAMVASGNIAGRRVLIAKPLTYMNLSGESVGPLSRFYKVDLADILLVSDQLDSPLGTLRMRPNGSSGGQNGLKHIFERLGTQEIARLRLGISRPPGRMDPAAWVLSPFRGDDAILAAQVVDRAILAMETWLRDGTEAAMNRYNGSVDTAPVEPKPTGLRAED